MSAFDNATRITFVDLLNSQTVTLQSLQTLIGNNADKIADLTKALDTMWLLNWFLTVSVVLDGICELRLASAYLVFIMQLGFALLEAGSVRAMNTKNILMQNTLDTCISIVMYWLVGFGISTGTYENNVGFGDMSQSATKLELGKFPLFIFLWAFCNAATTIVSGAVTSRIKFFAYMASCVLISGFVFPVVAYWTWSGGWLSALNPHGLGVIDFAGGTVVHMVGGFSGLMGCIVVGPRTGRFVVNDDGTVEDHRESGHSIVLATIGTFLLWFGWFGFNSGSTLALSNGAYLVAGNAAVNSLVATASAGLAIVIWSVYSTKVHDMWELQNGMLCGLVAITPACATVTPWGAIIIGVFSIVVYRLGVNFVAKMRIDDVVDAFAVHGCCGCYGTLMTGLLSTQENCDLAYGAGRIKLEIGRQFGIQLLAVVTTAVFVSACALTLFLIIKYTVGIRVSEADERVGLDFKYHAGYAYPDFNARVKKAHEQISMEAEIQNQVRKAIQQGKGNRFKDAVSMPASPFDSTSNALQGTNTPKNGGRGTLSSKRSRNTAERGITSIIEPTNSTAGSGEVNPRGSMSTAVENGTLVVVSPPSVVNPNRSSSPVVAMEPLQEDTQQ